MRVDRLILKILDSLNYIARPSIDPKYTEKLFLADFQLRSQISELQHSPNPKVFAKASAFIAKHYASEIVTFEDEVDILIVDI